MDGPEDTIYLTTDRKTKLKKFLFLLSIPWAPNQITYINQPAEWLLYDWTDTASSSLVLVTPGFLQALEQLLFLYALR